ncbi:MAG TPA: TlpA disulfide reductase family protein [Candidatus Sulfotelmatobacter sp.]|nr:TlpA disulfide reductase family protein [Candidatus Sulfotelmatobacter sp.]
MLGRAEFLTGLVAVILPNDGSNRPPSLKLGVPTNWRIRVLDGPDFHLADHRGSVVVATFFATWCPACVEEQPAFVTFANAHPDTVVLAVDVQERDDTVRAWRKRFAIPYRIAMDENGGFLDALTPKGVLPTTIVFDPNGCLYSWHYDESTVEWLEQQRADALAAAAPSPAPAASASPAPS